MANQPKIIHEKNYIIIKNALSAEICELLSKYAHFKASINPIVRKDLLANAHREYGDPMMETLLQQFTPLIEEATQLKLWPTLSFYYTYKNGNQLQKHTDRSSCQIVAGLCIGADDEFKNRHGKWPLVLDINGKPEEADLEFGDMIIFRGYETEHWREAFTGTWFVSAIFGFVEQNGPFAFQKFDQRKALGKPHIGMLRWLYGCMKNNIKQHLLT